MRKNNPDRWHFTTQTNANGYTYVYAYQTAWDPEKKRSRRVGKKYVGRLREDGRVDVSPKFAEAVPAYAEGEFFYGADKTLVDRSGSRADVPARAEPEPEPEPEPGSVPVPVPEPKHEPDEAPENESQLKALGLTWAAEELAKATGIEADLTASFGPKLGRALLDLAIFTLDDGGPVASFDEWREDAWLSSSESYEGERIDEILARVARIDRADFEAYFRRRRERWLAEGTTEKKRTLYALDNSSISTSYETVEDVENVENLEDEARVARSEPGRHPALRRLNSTLVCDGETGDVLFVHAYEGFVDDTTALQETACRMTNAGLDWKAIVLVTDRDCSGIRSFRKVLDPDFDLDFDLGFIQGVRVLDESLTKAFDTHRESLKDIALYNSSLNAYATSVVESRAEEGACGLRPLHLHLYRFPGKDEDERIGLATKAEEILAWKRANLAVPAALRALYGRYVREANDGGPSTWVCDYTAVEEACRYKGLFAVRSNVEPDPMEALRLYRLRNVVEIDLNTYERRLTGARVGSTEASSLGTLLVTAVAAALRLMMVESLRKSADFDLSDPAQSLDSVMRRLRRLRAEKRANANAWVSRRPSATQCGYFALLGVPTPPRVLRR